MKKIKIMALFLIVALTFSLGVFAIDTKETSKNTHDECDHKNSDLLANKIIYSYDELTKNKKTIEFVGVTIIIGENFTNSELFSIKNTIQKMIDQNDIPEQNRGNCGHNNWKCISSQMYQGGPNASYCSYYYYYAAWRCQNAGCTGLLVEIGAPQGPYALHYFVWIPAGWICAYCYYMK
ncbi:MAG: hypothetical protein FWC41_11705 [Firmicutes bacterium]|nr:hypothetical protein [Bacillota bacterium]